MEDFKTMLDDVYNKLDINENQKLILPDLITVSSKTRLHF